MTEIKGGSDLGAAVETIARPAGAYWLLTGEKFFASNASAELAIVAARPEGAAAGVRGLALFLVPRYRKDGELNYFVRRRKDKIATRSVPTGEVELKDSEGYLLGSADLGIYLILEVLNLSCVANSVVSVALAQRAMTDALSYSEHIKRLRRYIVPFVPVGWGRRLQRIEGKSLILALVVSIPTAPTNHLPDWWTLRNFTRGQKGADKANDPVLVR